MSAPQIDSVPEVPQTDVKHFQFNVKMSCGGCSGAVERALKKHPNEVTKSVVSLQDQLVDVWGTIPYDAVLAIIKKTGKEVLDGKEVQDEKEIAYLPDTDELKV